MERELCLPLPWLILSPCYSFRNIKRAHLFVSPFHILLPLHSHLSSTSIPISYLHPTPSVHFFPKGTVFSTFTASFSFRSIGSTCCFSGMERFFGGNADLSGNSQSTDCFLSLNWEGQPDVRFSMGETVGHGHHHTQGKRNLPISRNPQLPPPTIGPLQLAADAGLSCIGSGGDSCGFLGKVFIPEAGRSLMVSTNDVLGISRSPISDGGESRDVRREFRNAGGRIDPHVTSGSSERKRKATYTGKMGGFPISPVSDDQRKVATEDDSNVKRNKLDKNVHMDEIKPDVEQNGGRRAGKEDDSKTSDPSKKDYIHVRARRGQATDSHSLAERVRREKISERMKFLQDLVPGCNKVTGKAVMLDEIINYVQSLQQQVEFLSMKLATVNPQADFNLEDLLQKQIQQLRSSLPSQSAYPMDCPSLPFSFSLQPSPSENIQSSSTNAMESHCYLNPLERNLRRTINMQLQTVEGFGDASSQVRSSWEDDLHSVVQMGLMQKQEANSSLQPHNVAGIMAMIHKKLEP